MKKIIRADTPDDENPEWTRERIRNSIRLKDLPPSVQRAIANIQRGPQQAPTKVAISIRLSADVAAGLRATGAGWQTRADEALRSWLKTQQPAAK
jgi:uncharacterized protein (DUF4415 family)